MSDNLLLDIIARSIGRTITQENYRQRAADVLRSVKENDLTLPQPTNLIEHEITRLRAENKKLREAVQLLISTQEEWERSVEKIIGKQPNIFLRAIDRARAALEGAPEPSAGDSNA